jgi:hypothetical protein
MKKKTLFAVLGGGLSLALAAAAIGGIVGMKNVEEVGASTAGTVDLSKGVFTAAAGSVNAYTTWAGTYWTVKQLQGASTTAVNETYKTAPRIYKGHYLSFEAPDGVTFDSIVVTYTGNNTGSDLTCGASTTSNGAVPVADGTKPTGAITLTQDKNALTWTTADLSSAKSVYIQNSYTKATSSTQLRPVGITINYTSTVVVVNPTAVAVSLSSSSVATLGATSQGSVTFTPANTTDKTVTWSSSNTDVAVVDATGLVTAVGAGSANIIATSNAVSTVTGSAAFTVTAEASTIYDKVQTPTHYAVNNGGYPTSGYYANLDNILYYSEAMGVMNGAIQGQKTNGLLYNKNAFSAAIKDVVITLDADGTAPCSVAFGATANTRTDVATPAVAGAVNTFTPSGSYSYFTIYSPTTTLKMASIVVELVDTDVEAARTWASNFLSATSVCDSTGAADNITSAIWTAQSDAYTALSANAKTALTVNADYGEAGSKIGQAIARYKYIVNKYTATVHANFLNVTVTPAGSISSMVSNEATAMISIAIVSVLGLLTLAGVVVLKKKHN